MLFSLNQKIIYFRLNQNSSVINTSFNKKIAHTWGVYYELYSNYKFTVVFK